MNDISPERKISASELLSAHEIQEKVEKAVRLYRTGEYTAKEIYELTGIRKTTLYKNVRKTQLFRTLIYERVCERKSP